MSACTCLSRSGLTIINLLFCVAGGALIFLGSYLFHEFAKYGHAGAQSLSYSLLPAFILIVIGILAIILGFIGCMAACTKDKKCITGTYFTMLLLLLLGLVTGAILSMLYHKQLDDSVHDILLKGLDKYLENKDMRASVDVMQSELKCCGVDNTTDWLNTPWYKNQTIEPHLPYPESCYTQNNCTYDEVHDEHLNDKGCYKLVKVELRSHLFIVACVAAAFSVILIIGMVLSCVLLVQKSRRSREVQYVGLADPDGGMRI